MSFINTEEPLRVGGFYQYREADGGTDPIDVELIRDTSDDKYWKLKFRVLYPEYLPDWFEVDKKNCFKIEMEKGSYYFPGMPRIWDEGEY